MPKSSTGISQPHFVEKNVPFKVGPISRVAVTVYSGKWYSNVSWLSFHTASQRVTLVPEGLAVLPGYRGTVLFEFQVDDVVAHAIRSGSYFQAAPATAHALTPPAGSSARAGSFVDGRARDGENSGEN